MLEGRRQNALKRLLSEAFSPETPDDWQLYPGGKAKSAAKALTAALAKAIEAVKKGMSPEDAYAKFVEPVGDKYAAQGASDTEPRNVALDALEAEAEKNEAVPALGEAKTPNPASVAAELVSLVQDFTVFDVSDPDAWPTLDKLLRGWVKTYVKGNWG
jgi:CO/xanthine dehydrogenase Mo-binding subunit